jgi:hypothetical protein
MLAFLVDPEQIVRLSRLAEALKARHPGLQITRPDAARAAVHVGIETLEREMGLSTAERSAMARQQRVSG